MMRTLVLEEELEALTLLLCCALLVLAVDTLTLLSCSPLLVLTLIMDMRGLSVLGRELCGVRGTVEGGCAFS